MTDLTLDPSEYTPSAIQALSTGDRDTLMGTISSELANLESLQSDHTSRYWHGERGLQERHVAVRQGFLVLRDHFGVST